MDSADGVDLPDLLLYDSSWWALIKIYEGKVEKRKVYQHEMEKKLIGKEGQAEQTARES